MPNLPVLVIGGGPAGLEAARGVADLGYKAVLVEKESVLGGRPILESYAALTPDMRNTEEAMNEMIGRISNNEAVDIRTGATVTAVEGEAPNFKVTLQNGSGAETLDVSSVIVSTGFQHFDPGRETQMYGYYEFDDVITLTDAEKMLKAGKFVRPSTGEAPKRVAFIQCVGSRDRQIGNKWCSKVCCGIASKQASEIRHFVPDAKLFIFYIDLRAYGFWEDELYWKAQEENKVNYIRGIVTEINKRGESVVVKGEDTTMGRPMEIPMDMVILSVGMEPSEGTKDMSKLFNLPLESHGYIATTGGALNTVETTVPGVFIAGAAGGPADLEDSVSMAGAAASRACAFIRKSEMAVA
ncbi:FAD-dependent pyridine nucleotide-disulphide oxidoreductase [Chloroherpeton thalassium ATCC 35110]|uniref:FAD-dependent pyridine nucleotide-disulphide oxidoreductase n=1 Tax=Chloroherpeton thalassium (strain ATCC 35110 / GB-78) TaxID=517418 RepID=B3QSW4_CHLT3|nr:FAD-dependent oxidoreductase [Chloroherpeton thalassium]ACF12607.1 FAD-dependent pyridine nucleotide-disulphide oxidoreductase [Chloroherpeton thalassium ATCC 35110]